MTSTRGERAEVRHDIHSAAAAGDLAALRRLAGVDVNRVDDCKRTAAHIAAENGQGAAIMTLEELGANLNLEDCNRMTPMQVAAARLNCDAVVHLKVLGCDFANAESNAGLVAIHCAAGLANTQPKKGKHMLAIMQVLGGGGFEVAGDSDEFGWTAATLIGESSDELTQFLRALKLQGATHAACLAAVRHVKKTLAMHGE